MSLLYDSHPEHSWARRRGAVAGLAAGAAYILFEMAATGIVSGPDNLFAPLQAIAGIVLGPQSVTPEYSIALSLVIGLALHALLSVLYGILFAALTGGIRAAGAIVLAGCVYGFALWFLNFQLIAPALFPWFVESNVTLQILGHVFAFGAVLGVWIGASSEPVLDA